MSWESEAKLQTLQKLSPYIWISYKLVLKSLKSLNRIFWKIEYWFKALECQIWSMNTKPFFWESEAKLQILQKFSPYIGVSFKFISNFCQTPKSNLLLGRGILVQDFRMPNLVDEYKSIFLGKRDKPWNSSKNFSLYWSDL